MVTWNPPDVSWQYVAIFIGSKNDRPASLLKYTNGKTENERKVERIYWVSKRREGNVDVYVLAAISLDHKYIGFPSTQPKHADELLPSNFSHNMKNWAKIHSDTHIQILSSLFTTICQSYQRLNWNTLCQRLLHCDDWIPHSTAAEIMLNKYNDIVRETLSCAQPTLPSPIQKENTWPTKSINKYRIALERKKWLKLCCVSPPFGTSVRVKGRKKLKFPYHFFAV